MVVGSAYTAATAWRAARWDAAGRIVDLGALPGDDRSGAWYVDRAGTAVGFSIGAGSARPVVWDRDGRVTALSALPGGAHAWPAGIGVDGTVVGGSTTATTGVSGPCAGIGTAGSPDSRRLRASGRRPPPRSAIAA
ncbi:hypothetical protein GCM10022243_56680 [Saccharothrix violaceirubra]